MAKRTDRRNPDQEDEADPTWPRKDLFKELARTYWNYVPEDEEAKLAEDSLYGWWWKFLKESDEYWSSEPGDPIYEMKQDFGYLDDDFAYWWRTRGRDLFSEREMVPIVRVVGVDTGTHGDAPPGWIDVRIPMSIPRKTIEMQLDAVFRRYHPGNELLRHAVSTARRRIYPRKRYHRDQLETLYKVWTCKRQNPAWRFWEVGEHLSLVPHNMPEAGDTDATISIKRREHDKRVRELYDQAKELVANAARGNFPLYSSGRKRRAKDEVDAENDG
jgi:hypothetical protein